MPVDQTPDHELMRRTACGDLCAYRELVDKHLNRGVKVAERMLGNRQDAEDVMQETCLKIWKEAPRWRPEAKFTTWLYRVLLNACLDRKRRAAPVMTDNLEGIFDTQPLAEDILIWKERSDQVKCALQLLPERQRAALVLNYYEEQSNQDAADAMGIALGAYQQLLFRARQKMKDYLLGESYETAKTGS
ncbi:MAG: sigma-70 family RNA polymerase sigma factor [Alphaproteobacteria bacterium]|nr:sigma-70 family RNA polymerase sigma factor [Alphaproteobacteria bacterium]